MSLPERILGQVHPLACAPLPLTIEVKPDCSSIPALADMCTHANCVPTCSHLITALNLSQAAITARGGLWTMGMGWEQLEQTRAAVNAHQPQRPRAAVNAHQPQRPFGALFATSPLHVPCRNGAEERKFHSLFAASSAAHSLRTYVGDRWTPQHDICHRYWDVCGAPSDVHTPCSVYCLPPLPVPVQNGRYRACINHHSHPGQPWHHLASCPAQGMLLQLSNRPP